jgi:hypothetical protein
MMMGSGRAWALRLILRQTSMPESVGSIQSSTIRSGRRSSTISSASSPSTASPTSKPPFSRL